MRRFILLMVTIPLMTAPSDLYSQRWQDEAQEKTFSADLDRLLKVRILIDDGEVKIAQSGLYTEGSVGICCARKWFETKISFGHESHRLIVRVDREGWSLFKEKKRNSARTPEVKIKLPTDVSLDIYVKVKAGEIDCDLGGLRVKEFTLNNWAGRVDIDISEENPERMEYFEATSTAGEMKLSRLGNANFEEANINAGVGELCVDFSGRRLRDTIAKVDLDIGETIITLPDDIGAKVEVKRCWFLSHVDLDDSFIKRGHYYYNENYENVASGLILKISPGIGEVDIRTR